LATSSDADGLIGASLEELDTPALLLDGSACERNLRQMADYFRERSCRLRPHFKNHKCATLARKQMEAGAAVGMTCAKLGEAEVLVERGFDDILIANQVVGARKMARLIDVARKANIKIAIDHPSQADAASSAADAAGVTVGVLIEVDGGMSRCGVAPGEPALELARRAASLPGIDMQGIQCYEGHAVYIDDFDERSRLARESMLAAIETQQLIQADGIPCGTISGGSSSTYKAVADMEGVSEIQSGTYATMDWRYHQLVPEFDVALSILARVISARPGVAVLDVGVKGAGCEFGPPRIKGHPEAVVSRFQAEEHCKVENPTAWQVGDAVELLPSHACTTCNLYRRFHVHNAGRVEQIWPIEGSGKLA